SAPFELVARLRIERGPSNLPGCATSQRLLAREMRPFFRCAPPGSGQVHGDLLVLWSAWAKLLISRFILVSGEYRNYSRERSRASAHPASYRASAMKRE